MTIRRPSHPRLLPASADAVPEVPLGPPRASLVGRARDVVVVRARLLAEDVRLLTLTGPAGVGKTRLALAVADALAEHPVPAFADGVTVVELAPIREPRLVLPTLARAFGLRVAALGAGDSVRAELAAHLAEQARLLILDNLEHVLDVVPDLGALLDACPGLTVLATSRAPLRLYGEHQVAVEPLGVPDQRRRPDLAALSSMPAVALFVERARAARATFALTEENAADVAELCVRLDGLPLALELAAARVTLLSPRAILARLDRRLDVLARGPRDHPARQQTLRGALDWSYDLLGEVEQAVFRRLGVFVGGCSVDAAEAVAAHHAPLDVLASLVDQSLMRSEDGPEGESRLLMLETVREYARERLAARGEADDVMQRHAMHFVALAEEADPKLRGPDQLAWLVRLEADHANLRAALGWSLADTGRADLATRLAAALAWFWYLHGHFAEGQGWIERALAVPGAASDPARGRALNGLGNLAYARGDYARAAGAYEEALVLFRADDDRTGVANLLNNLGNLARAHGDYARASELLDECLALRRGLGEARGIALALNNLGLVAQHRGDYARAGELFEECLALQRELGDRHHVALALNNLGNVAQHLGDRTRAAALHEENLTLCREIGDTRGVANALNNLAIEAQYRGDYERATELLDESLALSRKLGDRDGIANAVANLGSVAHDRSDPERAEALIREGLGLYRALGHERGIAWALNGLGGALCDRGDPEQAATTLDDALTRFRALGDRRGIGVALAGLGDLARDAGDDAGAATRYGEAIVLGRETGDLSIVVTCIEGLAGVAAPRGRAERAAHLLGAAESLREAGATPLPPRRLGRHERDTAAIRAVLDADWLASAWSSGRATTRTGAIDDALAEAGSGHTPPESERPGGPGGLLTRREREVVALVARGMTNRAIAAELVITEGTVGTHVEHILRKLDVRTRTQVAAWVHRAGLDVSGDR